MNMGKCCIEVKRGGRVGRIESGEKINDERCGGM